MKKIAILASGSGSNAENIVTYFHRAHPQLGIRVAVIIANRRDAYVIERAKNLGVPCEYLPNKELSDQSKVLSLLEHYEVAFIVLAGYLALVPEYLIRAYPHRIVNIHPALLPNHGGKGMFGMHVHEAVRRANDSVSGITIHEIDEDYDRGHILFQATCVVSPEDTPHDIADHVHELEMRHFPRVIGEWIRMRSGETLMVRPSTLDDLPAMLHIYSYARSYMKTEGNPYQWGDAYPSEEMLRDDIAGRRSFVVVTNHRVVGAFCFFIGDEPTYHTIEGGKWIDDERAYGVIHRIAAIEEGLGLLNVVLMWAANFTDNLRIDTHADNTKMQSLLERQGFEKCGIIHLANGDERIAFQRITGHLTVEDSKPL